MPLVEPVSHFAFLQDTTDQRFHEGSTTASAASPRQAL